MENSIFSCLTCTADLESGHIENQGPVAKLSSTLFFPNVGDSEQYIVCFCGSGLFCGYGKMFRFLEFE
jgi:hypothetical protein